MEMTSPIGSNLPRGIVNGMDTETSSGGFRHQMPQIAVMSRNPKIAQSKSSLKESLTIETKSTTEVEGVGKVVHIGSELMDIDDAEKKLLDQFESSQDENEENVDINKTKGDKGSLVEDSISKTGSAETKEHVEEMDIEEIAESVSQDNLKLETAKESEETDNKGQNVDSAVLKEQPTAGGVKSRSKRRSVQTAEKSKQKASVPEPVTQNDTKAVKNATAPSEIRKGRRTRSIESVNVKSEIVYSPEEPGSPSSKRLRKPKKLDLEPEGKSPPPPKVKTPKPKSEIPTDSADKFPIKYMVGDLVWSKVTGHPWWPCMISYDPFTAQYTKVTAKKGRDYHVQFFGEAAERGWITTHNLLDFEGKAKFDEYVNSLLDKAISSKEKQRIRKWYQVPPARANAVDIGIAVAEEALPLSRNDRKANYTFVYKLPKSKIKCATPAELEEDVKIIKEAEQTKKSSQKPALPQGKKRKHEELASPDTLYKAAPKRRKLETAKSTPLTARKKTSKKSLDVNEASFDIYHQEEKANVLKEHPEFTEAQVMDFCRQQWCMMSQKQKGSYLSQGREQRSDSVSPTRNRKPSKKVLEAEEGNKALDEVLSQSSRRASLSSPEAKAKKTSPESKNKKKAGQVLVGKPIEADAKGVKKRKSQLSSQDTNKETEKAVGTPGTAKRGRPRKSVSIDAEAQNADSKEKSDVSESQEGMPSSGKTSTLIPAKRGKPKKSVSGDSDSMSDKQTDSGRSTPSLDVPVPANGKKVKEEFEYVMEIHKLSTAGPQKKENLCQLCEQTGDLLECSGPCQGFFHADCLGIPTTANDASAQFKCDECQTGNHTCFACKKVDSTTQRCSVPVCGKFYHLDCIKELPQAKIEGKGITCPLHSCHTCLANNLKATAAKSNGRLLRCVRCPTAYHVGDFCISAGSINLTGFNIVCAKHFQPLASQKHHSHVNVGWCFSCNKGGTLLCCESCPSAYHADCLKIEFPTGSWYCPDCIQGKRPLYGEIVWVKIGNYRWWPGEICHPRNVPVNIQEKPHQVGEFPVHFLGSHDYFWLHQERVFSFQEGDKGNKNFNSAKGLAKQFGKGLQEAAEAYKTWKEFKDSREQLEIEKESKKPAPFRMVKSNIPLGSVTIKKVDLSQIPRCECSPNKENPCSKDSDCLNHMMMYECHSALCNAGEKCQNQFFTKRQYPQQQSYKTEGRGWGLMALEDIKKGQFVNEYVGDLIDEEECKKRLAKAHEDDVTNYYMMTLDQDRIIDAGPKGNLSRFMNHSCDPNLETQKWTVNGDVRVGLFALRDIKKGEELTFNYNFDCLGNEQTKCCCGSDNCSGYLGVRPKTSNGGDLKKKEAKLNKLKKKKKISVKRKHDDDCFRCGEGGELVMCDRTSCPKSYHLQCLGLDKPPYGKWDCPWHHCDECGKPAQQKCVECPNSYCSQHASGNIQSFDDRIYCMEHEDLLQTFAESQVSATGTSDEASDLEQDEKPVAGSSKGKKDQGAKSTPREETLPPKKRGPKPSTSSDKDKANGKTSGNGGKLVNGSSGKSGKGKKSNKGAGLSRELSDDLEYVAPMFDDSEDEGFGLVIDIPQF